MRKLSALGAFLSVLLMVSTAWAQNFTLRFSTFHPHNHWYVQSHVIPLFAEIERVTEGRVKPAEFREATSD